MHLGEKRERCTPPISVGSSLPSMFGPDKYGYMAKTEDDTYFRLDSLVLMLRKAPKEEVSIIFFKGKFEEKKRNN